MRRSPPLVWIVCERNGRWAEALRNELADRDDIVRETRLADELLAELDRSRTATVAVVELCHERLDAMLDLLAATARAGADVLSVAVAQHDLAGCEMLAREAGAAEFVTSPLQLPALVKVAARHHACAVQHDAGLKERIWSVLPWPEAARTS